MRALVVYPYIPHYRRPIFEALATCTENEVHFAAASSSQGLSRGIRTYWDSESPRFHPIATKSVPGGLITLSGCLQVARTLRTDAICVLSDPHFVETWALGVWARIRGVRLLFWGHNFTRGLSLLKFSYLRQAHALLCYNVGAKRALATQGMDPKSLYVIFNSVSMPLATKVPALTSRDLERPKVIFSGRLTPQKQLDELFLALHILKAEGREWSLHLVGAGPLEKALRDQATRLAIPVQFHGECYDSSTLSSLYRECVATVSPGNVGLTAIQSFCCGVPVVTNSLARQQMPEAEAVIPGITGETSPTAGGHGIASALNRLRHNIIKGSITTSSCQDVIIRYYNAEYQRRVFNAAVTGQAPFAEDEAYFSHGTTVY